MTRKEIKEFGQHMADKLFHKKEQTNTVVLKGWVARDKNNTIHFYSKKPIKLDYEWDGNINHIINLKYTDFPQVNWEDDKPTVCEIMIKIEK